MRLVHAAPVCQTANNKQAAIHEDDKMLYPPPGWGKMVGLFAAGLGGLRMLVRCVVMVSLAVIGLSLAACAEMGEAMVASAAEQAAAIAATQAAIATTQTVGQLETAATQMSDEATSAQPVSLPNLPPVGKGNLIIASPNFIIVQTGGKRYIFYKSTPPTDDDANQ